MASTSSSSLSAKIPAILLTILPLLCLIPGFILAAYSSSHKDWTWRREYDQHSHAPIGYVHRGPFVSCSLPAVPNASDVCHPTLKPGGRCDENSITRADNQHFCRQLTLGGRLLYAGDTLLGAALLLVLVMTASTLPQILRSASGSYVPTLFGWGLPSNRRPSSKSVATQSTAVLRAANSTPLAFVTLFSRLFATLSALLLLIGTIITTNTLVNIQYPIGDWYTTGNPDNFDIITQDFAGPWLIGKAVGWCAASAVLAGLAAFAVGMVWEGPSVAVNGSSDAPAGDSENLPEDEKDEETIM